MPDTITNEVLLERVQNFFERVLSEIGHVRDDLGGYEKRLQRLEDKETLAAEWHHEHSAGPSHPDIQKQLLDLEKALGQLTTRITTNEQKIITFQSRDDYQKGVKDGITRSISWLDRGFFIAVAAIPTALLLYNIFGGG